MNRYSAAAIAALMLIVPLGSASAQAARDTAAAKAPKAAKAEVDKAIASWPNRPKLGAKMMIAKYGQPQEVTPERLVWHDAGQFKRITVLKLETPHDFPLPHVDFMEHTIVHNVPQDKVGDLIEFDGSSTINRTTGELSARCDLEAHNVLTLNLDHDILTGKKSVAEAREAFGKIVVQEMMGEQPPYIMALQFSPDNAKTAMFSDEPVIPGSPVRAADSDTSAQNAIDREKMAAAEILGIVATIDRNEIVAATQARAKEISEPVMAYATLLNEEHGKNMGQTLKLGEQINATPVITPAAEQMQKKAAGELAAFIELDGQPFERAYVAAMIKGHTEALAKIDEQIKKAPDEAALKQHLTMTRGTVASHLEKAKALEGTQRNASR